MNTMAAFAMGEANRHKPMMIFDWEKAARLIKENKPETAAAGLRSDWEYTGGDIYRNGAPVPQEETYTFLGSTWAVPELEMDDERQPCYIMESETEWDSGTYWPQVALDIING